jgi:membrane protein implicated in regulation of membrane protease activity
MKPNAQPIPRRSHAAVPADGLDRLHEDVDDLILQPVDEANFMPRPEEAGETYAEKLFEHRRLEQPELFAAEAEAACRPHREASAAAKVDAQNEQLLIDHHEVVTGRMWKRFDELSDVLVGAITRTAKEKRFYYGRMGLLLVGDMVAVAGGMITLGELPILAIVQAIAAGVAAITSGLIATEIKKVRQARERHRDDDSLSELQQKYRHLFRGPDEGEYLVKLVVGGGLVIVLLIGAGIYALRSTTQGTAAGLVFACLAVAVALASWVNSYVFADEWRDVLDVAYEQATRNTRDHQALTAAPARVELASSEASIASIQAEYEHRGEAAALRLGAEKHGWLTRFPGVVGHGRKQIPAAAGYDLSDTKPNSLESSDNGSGPRIGSS